MAIELPDGRCESNDVLDALRVRAVHARELGYAVVDIAAILGVREETVSRWCSRYERGGEEALRSTSTIRPRPPAAAVGPCIPSKRPALCNYPKTCVVIT